MTLTQVSIFQKILEATLSFSFLLDKAKNIILFLGDGMSIPTLAATRAYISQKKNQSGTEQHLSFDKFPFSGLSKVNIIFVLQKHYQN